MTLIPKTSRLSTHFFLFSGIIFATILALFAGFWLKTYYEELNKRKEQLPKESARIEAILTDSIESVAQYAEFVGEKIAQHNNAKDYGYISYLIGTQSGGRQHKKNYYFTTVFDWVTPDKLLHVSSKKGILGEPFNMADRDYLDRTPLNPWFLEVSKPRIGGISKQWIIPAGLGVTNSKGKFLGSITMGFSLKGLLERIMQTEGYLDIHYLILTKDLNFVLSSQMDSSYAPDSNFSLDKKVAESLMATGNEYDISPIKYKGISFTHIKRMENWPYIILVGYKANMPWGLFNDIVLTHLLEVIGVGILAFIMLYIMQRQLIRPVAKLAHAADLISKGENVDIEKSDIEEIRKLGDELEKISIYIKNERRISAELKNKTELLENKTELLESTKLEALHARDVAIKADKAKSEFLTNMSHELRTPMNAVIGLTNILLMQNFSPEKQKEYLGILKTSGEHLMELINDLLDIAKLEHTQVKLENVLFNLLEVINEVIEINKIKAKEKKIKLYFIDHTSCDLKLMGAPLRLKQVLINLLGNAIKFTEEGKVSIKVGCYKNVLNKLVDVEITVEDTGIGIEKQKLDIIFDNFTQADTSITRKYGGTGLGLYISKTLIEAMGGTISVESKVGSGSSFHIKLSLPEFENPAKAFIEKAAAESNIKKNSELEILLVEDNAANIVVVTTLLDNFGFTCDIAYNGSQALEKVQQKKYDLILMDIQMPELDGYLASKSIREYEKLRGWQKSYIIGISAHAFLQDREKCIESGMDDFIAKPFDPQDLKNKIETFAATSKRLKSIFFKI